MRPEPAMKFRTPRQWAQADLVCAPAVSSTVSVVIPCYNAAKTIRHTLASCWWQSRLPDEVIIVDDHSQDMTPQVLDEEHAPCVTVLRHGHNLGPGAARNTGARHATGEFIVYIDADDLMPQERIAQCLEEFAAGAEMVYGQKQYFERNDWNDRKQRTPVRLPTALNYLGSGCGASTVSVRRSVHTERGIWWDEAMSVAEDAEFLIACLADGREVCCSENVYSWVRLSNLSLTHSGDWGSMRRYIAEKHGGWLRDHFRL